MKSRRRGPISLSVLLITVGLLLLPACGLQPAQPPSSDPLTGRLDNLISLYKNGRISMIDISSVTDFAWDRLHIFEPYTPASYLDAAAGPFWRMNCATQIEDHDGITLLLFARGGSVVRCLDYAGKNAFAVPWPPPSQGYSPQQALFVLDDQARLVLHPHP
jgi:hypothetical protein